MTILTISGSTRPNSSNTQLLEHLSVLCPNHDFIKCDVIHHLPLFKAEEDQHPWQQAVLDWRTKLNQADALIICIPEYLHNMPALIKNALEWITSSGELSQKSVLPITFTPHPPRGKKAMQSLIWSLQALEARIVVELQLYRTDIVIHDSTVDMSEAMEDTLRAAIDLI